MPSNVPLYSPIGFPSYPTILFVSLILISLLPKSIVCFTLLRSSSVPTRQYPSSSFSIPLTSVFTTSLHITFGIVNVNVSFFPSTGDALIFKSPDWLSNVISDITKSSSRLDVSTVNSTFSPCLYGWFTPLFENILYGTFSSSANTNPVFETDHFKASSDILNSKLSLNFICSAMPLAVAANSILLELSVSDEKSCTNKSLSSPLPVILFQLEYSF